MFAFAAATTLIHLQVIADSIYVAHGDEDIAAEHYRTKQFRYFAVSNHISFGGGESKHLQAGCTSVPVLGIDAFFDVADNIFKRQCLGFNIGIGHSDYWRKKIVNCPGIARWFFSHYGSRFARVKPAFKYTFSDKVCFTCWNSLIIIFVAAPQSGNSSAINNIQVLVAKFSTQYHDFLQSLVFVNMVCFGQMSEGFVDEYASQNWIQDYDILAP